MLHRFWGWLLICMGVAMTPIARAQDEPPPSIPAPIDANARAAIKGINRFSLELYKREAQPGENLLLSPASVSVALGLAYRGAAGETAAELDRTLHFGAPPADYLRTDAQLLAAMNFSGAGREMRAANAVWFQPGMALKPDFAADIARYARAAFEPVDFRVDPETARTAINRWVEDATHDKIRDLLHPGDVTRHTRLTLVNAVYWKGKWESPFDKDATRPEPFIMADGGKVTTSLMHLDGETFQVLQRGGTRAILLPYQGGEVAMVVLLPKSPEGLRQFEKKLTDSSLESWLTDLEAAPSQPTVLTLPKMHFDWRSQLESTLADMGAPIPFSDRADFSGIATLPYPGGDPADTGIKIGGVVHQATIDVSEEATEAAAATAVGIVVSGRRIGPPPPPPFVFRADHPFLFALVDERTGMILFMGRYVKPDPGNS